MDKKSTFSSRYDALKALLIKTRRSAGFTQARLASRLSRPQSFVSKYERGERRLDVIEFIEVANALGVEPGRLIKSLK